MPEGRYTVQFRENFERGLPLGLTDLESCPWVYDSEMVLNSLIDPI